jgi:hypothetical protein
MALSNDIDEEFEIDVDPTLAWDHPTVDAITAYLVHGPDVP